MGYKLIDIQNLFNNTFNFDNLKVKAEKNIRKTLMNEKNPIYKNYTQSEIKGIKNARIEYLNTKITVNTSKDKTIFILNFELYTSDKIFSDYMYKVVYDYKGKFIDENLEKM